MPKGASLLEVGAGAVSIGRYLRCETTAVDASFDPRRKANRARVQASACSLPFSDEAWEVVCSIDMLEHIPPTHRATAIREMVRVGRRLVAVAVPAGEAAYREDVWTHEYYIRHHETPHRFAKEHVEYGLPSRQEIVSAFEDAAARYGRSLRIKTVPNLNLSFRRFYMKFALRRSVISRAIYVGMFPLAYLGPIFDSGNCYRDIFVVQFMEASLGAASH
jgi:ubiquinone/menaquinone biosynthesis C-methylase UbiE